MNSFPAELRTPPLPLIAFIGCPELHKDVGTYFNQALRPPFFSVGLAEPNEQLLVRLFGTKKPEKPFSTPDGILKADWFQKQRQRRAAVAVAYVARSDVEGDPSSWMHMLWGLRTIRSTNSHKGVQLLVAIVQDGPLTDLPPDRVAGLCSNLSIEQRHLCLISRRVVDMQLSAEERRKIQDAELMPLGQLVIEAAAAYYAGAAERLRQRQLDITATLGNSPPEINAAIAFKLAVLAEFRQDWLAAVSSYQAAAAALQAVPLGRPTVSCQRHAEVTAVAEVVHFKAMMLLLHQQRYAEAIQQLRGHLSAFGPLPDGLPLAAAAAHHGWLARQYQAAAEMVAMSRMDQANLQANKDVTPCYLLMSAAQIAITRKAIAEQLCKVRGDTPPSFDVASVRKGRYLGQVELKKSDSTTTQHSDMTDAEFAMYLEAEERRVNHSQQVMDLLLQAQALHLKQLVQAPVMSVAGRTVTAAADRLQARLAWLIAEQHIDKHNLTAARKLLLQTVHVYRRDGWDALLLQPLLLLRDVCQRLKLHQEALLHSLEVACLANTLAGSSSDQVASAHELSRQQQAVALAAAALARLLTGAADKKGSIMKPSAVSNQASPQGSAQVDETAQQGQQEEQQQQQPVAASGVPARTSSSPVSTGWCYTVQQFDLSALLQQLSVREDGVRAANIADVLQQHQQQYSGWCRLLTVSGGFVAHAPDPEQLQLCIALYNHLPVPAPLLVAAVTLVDSQGTWVQQLTVGPGPDPQRQPQQPPANACQVAGRAGVAAVSDDIRGMQTTGNQSSQQTAAGWPTQLQADGWHMFHGIIRPRCVGGVHVDELKLDLSEHCSVNFLLGSFPTGWPAVGRMCQPGGYDRFIQRQGLKQGMWATKVQHMGALPSVQVLLPELLLLGEFAPIEVRVSSSAPQSATSLELSLRSAMGAVPGQVTMLAALADGKLHVLKVEGHVITLPELKAGSCFIQKVWVRSTLVSSCTLVAVVSCPASVSQRAELLFAEPFEHVTRLTGELNVHTLVAPSSHSLAVSGAGPSDCAAGVALVVGQVVFAQVMVRAIHGVELQLLHAQVELLQDAGVQVINLLSDQLVGGPFQMCKDSVHCLLLQLVPLVSVSSPCDIGRVQLHWRRQQPAEVGYGSHQSADDDPLSGAHQHATAISQLGGAAPSEEVITHLNLPRVIVQDSLMCVRVVAPHSATAGIAFPFTLQISNMTPHPQDITVSVQEAQGFVFAGERQQSITVTPRDQSSLAWTLIAHASGQIPLPSVRVSSARFSCHVVTQQAHIHVLPF